MSAPASTTFKDNLELTALRAEWSLVMGGAVKYQMGGGVTKASAPTPWDKNLHCDCSALADWCAGVDKHGTASSVWQNTDALVKDALGLLKMDADLWQQLPAPVRGCLLVYGGHVDGKGKHHAGHGGVVVSATETIDCSSSGGGIRRGQHSVQWFLDQGAIVVAPKGTT